MRKFLAIISIVDICIAFCAAKEKMKSDSLYIEGPASKKYTEVDVNTARVQEAAVAELRNLRLLNPKCKHAKLFEIKNAKHKLHGEDPSEGAEYNLTVLFKISDSKCIICRDTVWVSLKASLDRLPPAVYRGCNCTDKEMIECAGEGTIESDSLYIEGPSSNEYTEVNVNTERVREAAVVELRGLRYGKPTCKVAELVKIKNAKHRLYGEGPSDGAEYDLTLVFKTSDSKCFICRDTVWVSLKASLDRLSPARYRGCNCTDKEMIECAAEETTKSDSLYYEGPASKEYTEVDVNNARVLEAAEHELMLLQLSNIKCRDAKLVKITNAKHRLYGEGPSKGAEYDLTMLFSTSDSQLITCRDTVWVSLKAILDRPFPVPSDGCTCTV